MSAYVEKNGIGPETLAVGPMRAAPDPATTSGKRPSSEVPQHAGAEEYDTLLWRLWSRRPNAIDGGFLVGLSGLGRQSGVSTLAANLGIRAADHGLRPVLLVDANSHSPQLHKLVRGVVDGGLVDVLRGEATVESCVRRTPVAGLEVLPLGGAVAHTGRTFELHVDTLVNQLREHHSLVICDLPPIGDLGQALLLARALDAALLVVRAARDRASEAQQAARCLRSDRVPLLGAVLTNQHRDVPKWLDRMI